MLKVLMYLVCISTFAQGVKFKGVNFPTYNQKGILESLIRCESATHMNGAVNMKNVTLDMFEDSKTVIRTPQCKYLQFEKRIHSSHQIFVKNEQMDITGKGFEYDQNTKELKIHQNVVIYLNSPEGESK